MRQLWTIVAFGVLVAACDSKRDVAIGADRTRVTPTTAPSAYPSPTSEAEEKAPTPRSDQKMIPGLDQGHTPGPYDTDVPLIPGQPPLDADAGPRGNPPPRPNAE
jgi:hypothetical protein